MLVGSIKGVQSVTMKKTLVITKENKYTEEYNASKPVCQSLSLVGCLYCPPLVGTRRKWLKKYLKVMWVFSDLNQEKFETDLVRVSMGGPE